MGCVKGEQSLSGEEGIGPAFMIGVTAPGAWPLLLLAQEGTQPSSDEAVHLGEGRMVGMLEVAEPASQRRIEVADDARQAVAARAPRLVSHLVLEPVEALLAHPSPASLEPVAQELEALAGQAAVADVRLV